MSGQKQGAEIPGDGLGFPSLPEGLLPGPQHRALQATVQDGPDTAHLAAGGPAKHQVAAAATFRPHLRAHGRDARRMLSHVDLQSGEPGPGRPSTHEQYSTRPTEGQEESPGRCASASGHHCWARGPSDLPGHQRSIPFTASLGRPLPGRRESARPSLLSLTVFCRLPPLPSRPALSIAAMSSLSCRRHGRRAPLGRLPSQGARLDVPLSVSSRALQGAQLAAQRQHEACCRGLSPVSGSTLSDLTFPLRFLRWPPGALGHCRATGGAQSPRPQTSLSPYPGI